MFSTFCFCVYPTVCHFHSNLKRSQSISDRVQTAKSKKYFVRIIKEFFSLMLLLFHRKVSLFVTSGLVQVSPVLKRWIFNKTTTQLFSVIKLIVNYLSKRNILQSSNHQRRNVTNDLNRIVMPHARQGLLTRRISKRN